MGGPGSGRKKGGIKKVNDNHVSRQVAAANVDDELNTKTIQHAISVQMIQKPSLTDPDDVERAFIEYLKLCDEQGVRSTVLGLAICTGLSIAQLHGIVNDESKRVNGIQLPARTIALFKQYYELLNMVIETQLLGDTGNPVKYIFLMKNHFHYTDQHESVITRKDPVEQAGDTKQIAAKYADLVEAEVVDEGEDEPSETDGEE